MFYYYDYVNKTVHETEEDWAPIGDSYMITIGDIVYEEYLLSPSDYIVEDGILIKTK